MDPEKLARLRQALPAYADLSDAAFVGLLKKVWERGMVGQVEGLAPYADLAWPDMEAALRARPKAEEKPQGGMLKAAARGMAQGVAGLIDLPALVFNMGAGEGNRPPVNMAEAELGAGLRNNPTRLPMLSDKIPQGETRGERMVQSTTAGMVGGLPFGPAGMVGGAAAGASGQAATEAGLPWWASLPISAAVGGGVSSMVGKAGNAARGVMASPEIAATRDAARRMGVPLRAGDVAPTSTAATIENALEAGPGAGMQRFMERQAEATANALRREASALAPASMTVDDADVFVVQRLRRAYSDAKQSVNPLFREAERLAEGQAISVPGSAQVATEVAGELAKVRPGSELARITRMYLDDVPGGMSYKDLRTYHKMIGAEVQSLTTTPGANEIVLGNAKRLYGAIQDDVDRWAIEAGEAGRAHNAAMAAFRERVAPFRDNSTIYRAARSNTDVAADNFIRSVMGGQERTKLLVSLLDDDGRRALGYSVLSKAADDALAGNSQIVAPGTAVRSMRLRDPARPTAQRTALRGAGAEQTATDLESLLRATQRSTGARQQPRTGFRNVAPTSTMSAAGLGALAGNAMGGPVGATVGGLLGAGAAGPMSNAASWAMTRQPFVDFLLARRGNPSGGLLGAYVASQGNRR